MRPGSWREGTQPKRRTRLSISLLLWFQLPWTWAGQAVNTQAQVTNRKILKRWVRQESGARVRASSVTPGVPMS